MNAFRHNNSLLRQTLATSLAALLLFFGSPADAWAQLLPKAQPSPPQQPLEAVGPVERAAQANLVTRSFSLGGSPDDRAIKTSRAFAEPIIPMAIPPVQGENVALSRALSAFKRKNNPEDLSDLIAFVNSHPNSRFRASMDLNIGLLALETGNLTDALRFLQAAWDNSKNQSGQEQEQVAQRAISELLMLRARLGMRDELKAGLAELGDLRIIGSNEERIDGARQGLAAMERGPRLAFKCGPYSLNTLANLNRDNKFIDPKIFEFTSSAQGTNLAQLKDWSDQLGLNLQPAKRTPGAAVLFPSVMHWRVDHFGAITAEHQGKFRVQDPTFERAGNLWLSKKTIDSQTDGFFLVPAGPLPPGWQAVSLTEAQNVWGKGNSQNRDEGSPPSDPNQCMGPNCGDDCGLAQASAKSMQAKLNIVDVPLSYDLPIGPDMSFLVNYNQLEQGQPSTWTFSNLGANWSFNWVSWLNVDASKNVTVHVRGGGVETYPFSQPDNVSNPYPAALTSQAVLTLASSGVYHRSLSNGSIEIFGLADGTGNVFMTQVIDPQGNATTINYDLSTFRVTSIVDRNSNATTVSYVSNTVEDPGYYKIASVTDAFGRSASFAYDSTVTLLTSITDAVGLVSRFTYAPTNSFIQTMATPYGSTSFRTYTPPGGTYPPRGLQFTFPDGTTSVIENWLDHDRNSYFWDREAMARFPNDRAARNYSHCVTTRWLVDPATLNLSPVAGWVKRPLESQVNFSYAGQGSTISISKDNLPVSIVRDLGGNVPQVATVGGAITVGDIVSLKVMNIDLAAGELTVQHSVVTGDTTATIATGLAAQINLNTALQAIGLTATTVANKIRLACTSASPTTYFASISGGGTEIVDIAPEFNPPWTATVSGTVTAGDQVGVKVLDANLQGGSIIARYTVKSGDNLNAVAAGIADLLNTTSSLQAIGMTASVNGAVVRMQSYSNATTTYEESKSGGATESVAAAKAVLIQRWTFEYNSLGRVTKSIDPIEPIGRTFSYKYAANNIDLVEIRETQGTDNFLLGKWEYANTQHVPTAFVDGSGRRSQFTNNVFGQRTSFTDALNGLTTYTYTASAGATVGGTVSNGKIATVTTFDPALPGGQQAVSYTATGSDTATTVATNLTTNLNANTNLQALGVSATSTGAVITVKSTSVNATTFTGSATSPMTVTLTPVAYGFLTAIKGPLQQQDITSFAWNSNGTLQSMTDSASYTLSFLYDSLDRLTKTTYPDNTSEQIKYRNLDAVLFIDRLGRTTQRAFDSMDQLLFEVDPLGRKTQFTWCACGAIHTLKDGLNQTTSWNHDLQGRVIQKVYADGTDVDYLYEPSTSRLMRRTDALNQKTNYSYNLDNTLASISYTDAINPTATVNFSFDSKFNRMSSAEKVGWGRYDYAYNALITDPFAAPITGGGRLASITNNVIPNSTVSFSFDALGRTTNRSINGSSNSVTWSYDAMSRITQEANALGNFVYTYVDNTSPNSKGLTRLASIAYPNSQTVKFSWYENARDNQLREIQNLDPSSQVLSQFNYALDDAGQITHWLQQQKSSHQSFALEYDPAGQLKSAVSGRGVQAPPFANQHFFGYDLAANRSAVQTSQLQNVVIGGTKTTNDVITITVADSALSGGSVAVPYTVQLLDTLSTIATNLAATITATASLQTAGIDAAANGTTITLRSKSPNVTTYSASLSGGATETATVGVNAAMHNATVGGSVTASDQVKITAFDPALSGGQTTVTYTVAGGDSLTAIATGLKNAINASGTLATAGITATSNGPVIAIQSLSPNVTSYAKPATPTTTETISFGPSLNGSVNAQVVLLNGESITTGDILTITAYDFGLSGGSASITETVDGGETLANLASNLATTINSNASLQAIGVSASASGARLTLTSVSTNPTSYAAKVTNSGGTALGKEAFLLGLPANGITTASISGTVLATDQFTLTVYDAALSGGSVAKMVTGSTTPNAVATALAAAVNTDTNLSNAGITAAAVIPTTSVSVVNVSSTSSNATTYTFSRTGSSTIALSKSIGVSQATFNNVNQLTAISAGGAARFQGTTDRPVLSTMTVDGGGVTMPDSRSFAANPVLSSGSESVAVSATSGGGSGTTTNSYKFEVLGASSQTLTYDLNGNMTSDGTNAFLWDAENRLIQITYPGSNNKTEFIYDGLGNCVKIVETTSGSVTSTKQFVCCDDDRCEARDGSGNLTNQYFQLGQVNISGGSGTSYFYAKEAPGSVSELTDSSGGTQAQYTVSPYGRVTKLQGSIDADFVYRGYYAHSRSGLNLTATNVYNPALGRWMNKLQILETKPSNRYVYSGGNPLAISRTQSRRAGSLNNNLQNQQNNQTGAGKQ